MNHDAERNPNDERKHHDWAHDVISQELPWSGEEDGTDKKQKQVGEHSFRLESDKASLPVLISFHTLQTY